MQLDWKQVCEMYEDWKLSPKDIAVQIGGGVKEGEVKKLLRAYNRFAAPITAAPGCATATMHFQEGHDSLKPSLTGSL